jgi:ArsR family transcriptional regulator, arsenate/arsenite/antimonite-responsive transcriptional repressor
MIGIMKKLLKIFKALSDKNRLRILLILNRKPLCVCELQAILGIAVSTVSKHLSLLRDAGFIVDEKEGKWVNYMVNPSDDDMHTSQLISLVAHWLADDEQIKTDLEKVKTVSRIELCAPQVN